MLENGDFESDDNNDGRPDSWDDSGYATRKSQITHSGRFALEHYASDDATYAIDQTIQNLEAGTQYDFSGWVNIPPSNDVFGYEFDLEVRWQNSNKQEISTSTLQKFTEATNGWHHVATTLSAPVGTTNAKVRMEVDSLNAIIFVDDFAFRPVQLASPPGPTPAPEVEVPSPATTFFGGAPLTGAGGTGAAGGTTDEGGTATFATSTDTGGATRPISQSTTPSASNGELMLEVVLVLTIALQIFGLMFIARTVKRWLQGSV